jgi:hypothetical protein
LYRLELVVAVQLYFGCVTCCWQCYDCCQQANVKSQTVVGLHRLWAVFLHYFFVRGAAHELQPRRPQLLISSRGGRNSSG